MARTQRSPRARADLVGIGRYITQESGTQSIADRFLDKIAEKCKLLARDSGIGEARPDLGEDIRGFPVGNYVIFYRTMTDGIELVRVLHGSRDIPAAFRRGAD